MANKLSLHKFSHSIYYHYTSFHTTSLLSLHKFSHISTVTTQVFTHLYCHYTSFHTTSLLLQHKFPVSAQEDTIALGKTHTHFARLSAVPPPPPLPPKVALETVPMLVWLDTDRSRPRRGKCRPLPFSTPLSFKRSMLSPALSHNHYSRHCSYSCCCYCSCYTVAGVSWRKRSAKPRACTWSLNRPADGRHPLHPAHGL